MPDMIPSEDRPTYKRREPKPSLENWNHPDPRLARIVLNAVQLGLPPTKVAKIAKVDIRTLKEHYGAELEHGKTYVSMQMLDIASEMALSGDQKMLIYMMKNWVEPHRDTIANPEQERQAASDAKGELNLDNLTTDELKLFMKLMNKAKPVIEADKDAG